MEQIKSVDLRGYPQRENVDHLRVLLGLQLEQVEHFFLTLTPWLKLVHCYLNAQNVSFLQLSKHYHGSPVHQKYLKYTN